MLWLSSDCGFVKFSLIIIILARFTSVSDVVPAPKLVQDLFSPTVILRWSTSFLHWRHALLNYGNNVCLLFATTVKLEAEKAARNARQRFVLFIFIFTWHCNQKTISSKRMSWKWVQYLKLMMRTVIKMFGSSKQLILFGWLYKRTLREMQSVKLYTT